MILVLDDRAVRAHLARAVAEHLRWCRRQGAPAPADLATLLHVLEATDGPVRSSPPQSHDPADAVAVGCQAAAARLGVSPRTIRRMTSDGRLPSVLVGRRRLIPAAALATVVERGGSDGGTGGDRSR